VSALLLVLVLAPFAGACVPALARHATLVLLAMIALAFALLALALGAPPIVASVPWVPALGLGFAVRGDPLGCIAALVIALLGCAAIRRLPRPVPSGSGSARAMLLLFTGLAQAVVLAENLLVLVALSGLSALAAWRLECRLAARGPRGARTALLVTTGGTLALLAATLLLGDAAGTFDLGIVIAAARASRAQPLYPLVIALLVAGMVTRCASWPRRAWLRRDPSTSPVPGELTGAALLASAVCLATRLWPLLAGAVPGWAIALGFIAVPFLTLQAVRALALESPAPASATGAVDLRADDA
jgi:multicomponent K+:H+ antiporter subunit A